MSAKGVKRPRESTKGEPWPKQIFGILGLTPEEEYATSAWREARSKTVFLDPENKVQISSRQYVLYTMIDSDAPRTEKSQRIYDYIMNGVKDTIYSILGTRREELKCIGFWRAHRWNNMLLVLINQGDVSKKPSEDGAPAAFRIVARFTNNTVVEVDPTAKEKVIKEVDLDKAEITVDSSQFYLDIKPFLNTTANVSDPPKIPSGTTRPFGGRALENARAFWDDYFTKNVSAVTKGRFQAVTQIQSTVFGLFTRLEQVVDKEDWFKMAVFLSADCDDVKSLHNNTEELNEATTLVKEGILHFSMMTMVDEYTLTETGEDRIDIIPAFRLWKDAVYVLFVRKSNKITRFFLCKHYPRDRVMLGYDPYFDSYVYFELKNPDLIKKRFFYIMPRAFNRGDDAPPMFDSLSDLCKQIRDAKDS